MSGIPELDQIISYSACNFLSFFISVFNGVVFTVFGGVLSLVAAFRKPKKKKDEDEKERSPLLTILIVIFGVAIFVTGIFCIVYGHDGRYSKTEIGGFGRTEYTYFGQAKNDVRFGFGKLFDSENKIIEITDAKGNNTYRNVTRYTTEHDSTHVSFRGDIVNGERDGYCESYVLVKSGGAVTPADSALNAVKSVVTNSGTDNSTANLPEEIAEGWVRVPEYNGYYSKGQFTGQGEYRTYDSEGNLEYYYNGGWAQGKKCGYGVELKYVDGELSEAYRGTFWNDVRYGTGIYEYSNGDGKTYQWLYYGIFDSGNMTTDGSYYNYEGNAVACKDNDTIQVDETGEAIVDDAGNGIPNTDRLELLEEKWPMQDRLIEIRD